MTETRTPTAMPGPVRIAGVGGRPVRILAAAALALSLLLAARGAAPEAHASEPAGTVHELRVVLDPDSGRIAARSVIDLQTSGIPRILLHPRMSVRSVRLDGQEARFTFEGGRLVPLAAGLPHAAPARLSIEYGGHFPKPVPTPQFGSDNPGSGVAASITARGVFLQGGSGWHPVLPDRATVVRLEVEAPQGFLAVTSGRLLGHDDVSGRTVSRWETRPTDRGLPLSAGPYVTDRLETGTAPVLTYLFPGNADLGRTYLEASARHLATYERLHGPYPFEHFAVVENFFPTGYGMPSYTLLGSTVLRLPFIPETSLRHEVAHCWWGNGVLVDYTLGNWSEGLTTYVADHLAQEEISPDTAREYRLRALRDYAQLAAGQRDLPLARFISRVDPATQAVGYGKAMFLAHMIRGRLGDERFQEGLRRFYRQWLFREASWRDLFAAFEGPGWDARERENFLRQWVLEPGAPELALEHAESVPRSEGWEVRAVLRQKGRPFDLRVPVRLETEAGGLETLVHLDGPEAVVSMTTPHKPLRLVADPDSHVFRLLAPEEIPPTVNSVKGADRITVVIGDGMRAVSRGTVEGFLASLDQTEADILSEREAAAVPAGNILFFGYPRSPALQRLLVPPASYGLTPDGRWFDPGVRPEADALDAIFVALPGAGDGGNVTALFHVRDGMGEEAVIDAARRITHYGKESYLGFERGRNRLRGAWPVTRSPLIAEFAP